MKTGLFCERQQRARSALYRHGSTIHYQRNRKTRRKPRHDLLRAQAMTKRLLPLRDIHYVTRRQCEGLGDKFAASLRVGDRFRISNQLYQVISG